MKPPTPAQIRAVMQAIRSRAKPEANRRTREQCQRAANVRWEKWRKEKVAMPAAPCKSAGNGG